MFYVREAAEVEWEEKQSSPWPDDDDDSFDSRFFLSTEACPARFITNVLIPP